MKRKLLATLLALCLIVGMIPVAASADNAGPWVVEFVSGSPMSYSTFDEAFSAVKSHEGYPELVYTILLTEDTKESITIKDNESAVLNIDGGVTLTNTEGQHTITVEHGGSLLVEGRGKVDNISHAKGAVYNNGYTELRGDVIFDRSQENGSDDATSGGNSWYTICNHGEMVISENVTVTTAGGGENLSTKGRYSSLIENGYQKYNSGNESSGYVEGTNYEYPSLTINGGNFSGGLNTIKNDDHGIVQINNGSFGNYYQCVVMNHHKATVTGGTFTAAEGSDKTTYGVYNCACAEDHDIGELKISGGTFTGADFAVADVSSVGGKITISNGTFIGSSGAIGISSGHTGVFSISGGTFSSNVSEYVADGYTMVESESGYTVEILSAENAVAQVGEKYFNSLEEAISAAENNSTVILLKNYDSVATGTITVPEGKSIVLDLNGYTVKFIQDFSPILVNGQITIQDTITGGTICSNKAIEVDKGTLTLKSGTIEVSDDYGIYVSNDGHAAVNGGAISSLYAPFTGNNLTGDMNFTVTDGTLTAKYGPAIYMPGQGKLDISGGTLNGGISLRMGQVNISGGTINATTGSIDSPTEYYHYSGNAWLPDALYVFNGTYTSESELYGNSLKLNITGGTFNCANDQGSAVAIYDLGKVEQSSAVTISGDARFSTNATDRSAYQVLSLEDIGVDSPESGYGTEGLVGNVSTSITSGYFTTDPSEYLAEGLMAVTSDVPGYAFTVGTSTVEEVKPAAGDPAVDLTKIPVEQQAAVESAASSVTDRGELAAAANTVLENASEQKDAAVNAFKESEIEGASGANNVNVYAQTYLSVTPTAYDSTNKTLTMGITPMYRVVATTANEAKDIKVLGEVDEGANAVVLDGSEKPLENINTMTISVTLPAEFASKTVYIQHKGYEYSATAGADCKITFTNPHGFSEFTFSTERQAVAEIDGTSYTSLQAAVDDATKDDTIVVTADSANLSATANKTVAIRNETNDVITVTINGVSRTIGKNATETFVYTSGGGIPSEPEEPTWPFTDVTEGDDWFYDAVAYVYENGIMAGTDETTFEPYMELDRAMAAQLFYNLEGKPAVTGDSTFTDVTSGHWAVDAITWAAQNDIVAGIGGGLYDPDSNVTREQFAVMLYKYARFKGYDLTATGDLTRFPDAGSISSWAETALSWANGNGLINGHENGTIDPKGSTIRAQAASIMANFDQNVAK